MTTFSTRITASIIALALIFFSQQTQAGDSEHYIGEIKWVAFDFCPTTGDGDWRLADGSLLDIASYTALYSLIGNTYGGVANPDETFALPDLRNQVLVSTNSGEEGDGPAPPWSNGNNGNNQGQGGGNSFVALTACINVIGLFPITP
jgi:hypothetical protein